MRTYALIVAGGSGKRMGSALPKQFIEIAKRPILMHTISKFSDCNEIILILPKNQIEFWKSLCDKHNFNIKHTIVEGGQTRFQSVKNGLELVKQNSLVAIHDGVRPFISLETIEHSFKVAQEQGNAIVCVDSKDSLRKVTEIGSQHVDRNQFKIIQTPQTFQSDLIKKAYQQKESNLFTDDASVLEATGGIIHLIDGEYKNIKITTPDDILISSIFISD